MQCLWHPVGCDLCQQHWHLGLSSVVCPCASCTLNIPSTGRTRGRKLAISPRCCDGDTLHALSSVGSTGTIISCLGLRSLGLLVLYALDPFQQDNICSFLAPSRIPSLLGELEDIHRPPSRSLWDLTAFVVLPELVWRTQTWPQLFVLFPLPHMLSAH